MPRLMQAISHEYDFITVDRPRLCSKFRRGSQNDYRRMRWNISARYSHPCGRDEQTWYLRPSSSSLSSMLPPTHSVTLNPSSLSSPVNSRLTPPNREPHSVWILIHEVNSLMMVPKWRVLSPAVDVCVLADIALVSCVANFRLDGMWYGRGRKGNKIRKEVSRNSGERRRGGGKRRSFRERMAIAQAYFPCMGSHIQATGWPDFCTLPIWPERCLSIWLRQMEDVSWPLES